MRPTIRDISVLIATRDRSAVLDETLGAMCRVARGSARVRFTIIDNGSSDATRQVVDTFAGALALTYLYEPEGGKSRAMNRALATVDPGDVVVFTDDDVEPCAGWFRAIETACRRWPDYGYFGGRISVKWPDMPLPAWVHDPLIRSFGYVHHDYGDFECPYPAKHYPFGPNFWLRRNIVAEGIRFDERVGYSARRQIMGEETLLGKRLAAQGHCPVYCPAAEVRHRIQPGAISVPSIRRRAVRFGRSSPYLYGYPRAGLRRRLPWVWAAMRMMSIGRDTAGLALAMASLDRDTRVKRSVKVIYRLASIVESLRMKEGGQT